MVLANRRSLVTERFRWRGYDTVALSAKLMASPFVVPCLTTCHHEITKRFNSSIKELSIILKQVMKDCNIKFVAFDTILNNL